MSSGRPFQWCKETYESSISSTCWWYTGYAGWEESRKYGPDLQADTELSTIVEMELNLHPLPDWAIEVVRSDINGVPPCGHYSFPAAYLRVLDAIGSERSNGFNYTCYTADITRKGEAMDYCLCLDAWLAGATPEVVAPELASLGTLPLDWQQVCTQLWSVLGERTQVKELLVERILLQLRWWIKIHVWSDDKASRFGRDQFLGMYLVDRSPAMGNGNWHFTAPTFDLRTSPRVQKIEAELARLLPEWLWFQGRIASVDYGCHPCAPKAFRFLERMLWAVGKVQPLEKSTPVPDFLSASATYPNQDVAADWWRSFLLVLGEWWQGRTSRDPLALDVARRLGEHTQLKAWLVRLYKRRLELHEECAEIGRLVRPAAKGIRGHRAFQDYIPSDPI